VFKRAEQRSISQSNWVRRDVLGQATSPPLSPIPVTSPNATPAQAIANLAQQQASLEVSTLDLCLLVFLDLRGRQLGLTSFDEAQLLEAFEQVCDVVDPTTENIAARANHAIRRLRDQRLLSRVDGAGIVRTGEFALSRLATAIVSFYLEEETLTKESLALLSRTLRAQLAETLVHAKRAENVDWDGSVIGPLEVTAAELIGGIERRQRGLDVKQQEFQKEISLLLKADWFGAIDQCQTLLESTTRTLRELNEMLMRDSQPLYTILAELLETADQSEQHTARHAVQRLIEQVDRIVEWGASRQSGWSEYYEYVHRYLRDVVRLDPSRALSQRLRARLLSDDVTSHPLLVASAPGIQLLRAVAVHLEPPPVKRPRAERTGKLETEEPKPDPMQILKQQVTQAIASGTRDLAGVTRELCKGVPEQERFVLAGRIAQLFAELNRPLFTGEREWVCVSDQLALEQRSVAEGGHRSRPEAPPTTSSRNSETGSAATPAPKGSGSNAEPRQQGHG
jgi:chromosome partition protein MukF